MAETSATGAPAPTPHEKEGGSAARNRPLLIAQRLNSGGSATIADALRGRDAQTIADIARRQAEAGADYLDLNAAAFGRAEEPEALCRLVEVVQEAVDTPLCLDSQNPQALRRALRLCRRPPLLNSFSGRRSPHGALWSLVRDFPHMTMIAVCYDAQGTHTGTEQRVEIAAQLVAQLEAQGVRQERIILDPVTLPSSCGEESRRVTLETMQRLRREFPEAGVLCAVGNFSYGLPQRRTVERDFAAAARACGADVFLCDVLNRELSRLFRSVIVL